MATKSRGDGYHDEEWVNYTHGNIVKEMKTNGWPPLINLAKELAEHGLVQFKDSTQQRVATVTPTGQTFLSNGTVNIRTQAAPPLTISQLHSEVQRIAGDLVANGHYRQAITDTFIGLDNYVETKSGISDKGTSLMQKAFSANKPILQLSTESEEQTGFMMLFTGAMKAIRNQYAHSLINPSSKEEAMEWLGFASGLFRLVDNARKPDF
ncbi:MAG: TIGR02391 family protein [Bdellovibrionales bacterium]|nr:TIGR02391 family protein [Bdellovibrionales bacterium]